MVRAEVIADPLEPDRVGTRGEAIGELGVLETAVLGLALGPFVPIDPHLPRIREVRTDLDEAVTEISVAHVEVIGGDASIGLVEVEERCSALGLLG